MDETPVTNPLIVGPETVKRDPRGRLVKGAANLNPTGSKGPRQMTAQATIEALYALKGDAALTVILKLAFKSAGKGNMTLLCKILDKILPSKMETKSDMTVTHREEFLRMRAKAEQILNRIGESLN